VTAPLRAWQAFDAATRSPALFVHQRDGDRRWWTPVLNGKLPDLLYVPGGALPPPGSSVVVCEGEPAADAAHEVGLRHAFGTVCGASSQPGPKVIQLLAGYRVTLSPDNDVVGDKHMRAIATALEQSGVHELRWVDPPPGAPQGWDLADSTVEERRMLVEGARRLPLLRDGPTWRTLAEVPDDPPEPLLLGILEPRGQTLMYGPPGIGKGMTGAWIVREAQRLGMRPMIYDAERREREWSRRVSGLGGDRARVIYVTPGDLGRAYAGRPLWDADEAITSIVKMTGSDLLFIDSILPAVGVGEERLRSDAQAPYLFVAALDALGIPSLSFGHPPKGQPEGEPFGSMAWVAAMRLTWLGTRGESEAHVVRWRVRKRNERGHLAGVLLTFSYGQDGRPFDVTREDDEQSTRDFLLEALRVGPRSVAEMADDLLEVVEDEPITEERRARAMERLRQGLRRLRIDGLADRDGPATGRGVRWHLDGQ
jgi:hypothetical protein